VGAAPADPAGFTGPTGHTGHGLTVLLAEHDPEVAELGRRYLTRAGTHVTVTSGADETTAALAARRAAVAVLDLTMPGLDPRRLRRLLTPPRLPVLYLLSSAMRPRDLRVAAESCLGRPFSPRLLVSRVLALAPRPAPANPSDPTGPTHRNGATATSTSRHTTGIALTPAESALLTALAEHPGRVLTRDRLQAVLTRTPRSGPGRPAAGRAVDVHVSQLRAKLPDPTLIRTVRGVGYVLDDPGPDAAPSGGG
jgi:DNA-binding response OmpR family regulator